jgi:hypothetical protein
MRQILLEGRALPVFPCRSDKRPTCPHGFKDAVADPKAIVRLWSRYPGPLIGVATGIIGGIDVIDVDHRNGGDKWFHQQRARLPITRTHETRGGGLHLIFHHTPGLRCTNGRIAPGVDTKGDGGYFIWWPAQSCRVLVEAPVADFPRWLLDEVTTVRSSAPNIQSLDIRSRGNGPPMVGEIPKPLYLAVKRRVPLSARVTRHHQRRVIGILSILTNRTKYRNDGLNIAAFCFRELIDAGIVSRGVAESLLLDAAIVCGYVAKDGTGAAIATIRSGLGFTIGGPSSLPELTEPTP